MKASAKITSKGQITLPAMLRRELGLKAGDRVDFVANAKGRYELVARKKTLADLRGIIPYDGPPLSDDDIVRMVHEARTDRGEILARRLKDQAG
jgi:AbrB family looped-hinge helix DNA binding protein